MSAVQKRLRARWSWSESDVWTRQVPSSRLEPVGLLKCNVHLDFHHLLDFSKFVIQHGCYPNLRVYRAYYRQTPFGFISFGLFLGNTYVFNLTASPVLTGLFSVVIIMGQSFDYYDSSVHLYRPILLNDFDGESFSAIDRACSCSFSV